MDRHAADEISSDNGWRLEEPMNRKERGPEDPASRTAVGQERPNAMISTKKGRAREPMIKEGRGLEDPAELKAQSQKGPQAERGTKAAEGKRRRYQAKPIPCQIGSLITLCQRGGG